VKTAVESLTYSRGLGKNEADVFQYVTNFMFTPDAGDRPTVSNIVSCVPVHRTPSFMIDERKKNISHRQLRSVARELIPFHKPLSRRGLTQLS